MIAAPNFANQRHVPLEGAVNFRDIGGYLGADGRVIRWRSIYRSDSLAELSDQDVLQFATLGISTICDLRDVSERNSKPNRGVGKGTTRTHAIGFLPYRSIEAVTDARNGILSADEFRVKVCNIYRHFAVNEVATFRAVFDQLLRPDALPLLVHCTSGKDRTGFAIALILSVLGVDDAQILDDYLLSNSHQRDLRYLAGEAMRPELLAVMMETHPSFLTGAFAEIDRRWGTRATYYADALGLSADHIITLRTRLLEPSDAKSLIPS